MHRCELRPAPLTSPPWSRSAIYSPSWSRSLQLRSLRWHRPVPGRSSTPYGFQWKLAAGLPPSGFDTGYVDVFSDRLRTIRPDVAVVNYSCPGETTTSFVAGACLYTQLGQHLHDHFEGSQLDAAVAFLEAHRGQVSPITLTLFGGDVREFIASCDGDLGCILANAPGESSRIAFPAGGNPRRTACRCRGCRVHRHRLWPAARRRSRGRRRRPARGLLRRERGGRALRGAPLRGARDG